MSIIMTVHIQHGEYVYRVIVVDGDTTIIGLSSSSNYTTVRIQLVIRVILCFVFYLYVPSWYCCCWF